MTPIRAAVVGAGIGEEYVRAFAREPDLEVVAVCARSRESARRVAEKHGVAAHYTSYESMLKNEIPEIVVVATPNHLHYPVTMAALESGAHVACEKPLGMTFAEATRMAERADELARRHLATLTWRFLPAARYAKELLDDGFVGTPYHGYARYHVRGWGDPKGPMRWQFDAAYAGSGALANLGSHAIHLVQWWLGAVRRVTAQTTTAIREREDGAGSSRVSVEDTCMLLAELESGTPVAVSLSSVAYGPRVSVEIGVFGDEGALLFKDDWNTPDAAVGRLTASRAADSGWVDVAVPPRLVGDIEADHDAPLRGCFAGMAHELTAAVRENRPATPDFHDGALVQAVIDAALVSAADARWVATAEIFERAAEGSAL
jgi:predicted dehydrogenase